MYIATSHNGYDVELGWRTTGRSMPRAGTTTRVATRVLGGFAVADGLVPGLVPPVGPAEPLGSTIGLDDGAMVGLEPGGSEIVGIGPSVAGAAGDGLSVALPTAVGSGKRPGDARAVTSPENGKRSPPGPVV
jgi:hypothetical protein